jgi:hypothetical protein
MSAFPIYFFLIPYALLLCTFVVFSIFNVYHLLRYGVYNFNLYILSIIYIGGSLFILGASLILILGQDWSIPFSIETVLGVEESNLFPPL